ncbi:MAG: hypothetical protein MSG64_16165 [Pyrinomonadaceae bacterium MAG19_C2-C3]|nr:hypothetical protein [Pyrinomonadaceae bacterium MAG19_C2-C3]
MTTLILPCATAHVSRTRVTSRINRTLTPSGVLGALTDETTQSIIPFDECCLFLRVPDDETFRVWYASPSGGLYDAQASHVAQVPPVVTHALTMNSIEILSRRELSLPANRPLVSGVPAQTIASAAVLPLSTDDESFGVLVFTGASEVYDRESLDEIRWLVDHIAVAVQAALLREQLNHQASDEISALDNLNRAFVHTLVRDVRLPLTGVLNFLDSCEVKLRGQTSFDDDDLCLLNTAITHTQIICRTMDDHLAVARDEDRPLVLSRTLVAPSRIITDAVEYIHAEASLRGIRLHAHLVPALPDLDVDARHVTRALIHLLTTALAATGDGGEIYVEAVTTNDDVMLSTDDKAAIALNVIHAATTNDEAASPCDSFWHSPASPHYPDIGFAVACRIARAHGGDLITHRRDHIETIYSLILPVNVSQAS